MNAKFNQNGNFNLNSNLNADNHNQNLGVRRSSGVSWKKAPWWVSAGAFFIEEIFSNLLAFSQFLEEGPELFRIFCSRSLLPGKRV